MDLIVLNNIILDVYLEFRKSLYDVNYYFIFELN